MAGIVGFGADAVGLLHKDPVAGIDAAAHDEIGCHGRFAVGGHTQDDAPAGIGIAVQAPGHGLGFVDVHSDSSE